MKIYFIILLIFIINSYCANRSFKNTENTRNLIIILSEKINSNKEKLIWSDEFEYDGLPDSTKWDYDVGGHGWGNNELQYYTSYDLETSRVSNGKLILEAHKKPTYNKLYKSARLITKGKFDFLYGKVEISAKLPSGKGIWPALWLLPTEQEYGTWPNSGEIDIMEMVGFEQNWIYMSIHTKSYNHKIQTHKSTKVYVENANEKFHVYSLEWYVDKIDFFIDGQKRFTFQKMDDDFAVWPFDQKFYLILNIAVGGNWAGMYGIDDSIFPQKMEIDYVRIYKLD